MNANTLAYLELEGLQGEFLTEHVDFIARAVLGELVAEHLVPLVIRDKLIALSLLGQYGICGNVRSVTSHTQKKM